MYSYKAVLDGGAVRGYQRDDGVSFLIVPVGVSPSGAYELFKLEQAQGATVLPADPESIPPPAPDYGGDADDEATFRVNAATVVANLRGYLALASPTQAQSTNALKLLIRVVLFLVRRVAL